MEYLILCLCDKRHAQKNRVRRQVSKMIDVLLLENDVRVYIYDKPSDDVKSV